MVTKGIISFRVNGDLKRGVDEVAHRNRSVKGMGHQECHRMLP